MKAIRFQAAGKYWPEDPEVEWVRVSAEDAERLLKLLHLPLLDSFVLAHSQLPGFHTAIADHIGYDTPLANMANKLNYGYKPEWATASYLTRNMWALARLVVWAKSKGCDIEWVPDDQR